MRDHALGEEPGKGFAAGQIQLADIPHRTRKKTGIEQVQHGMFHAADILIDRQPIGPLRRVIRTCKPGVIPGTVGKCVKRIGLAPRRATAFWTDRILPGRVMVQRVSGPVKRHVIRQPHGQIV